MDKKTLVYKDLVGQYGFHYPDSQFPKQPIEVSTQNLYPHPCANEARFRTVANYVPLLLVTEGTTITVWRPNANFSQARNTSKKE